ncbi:MAG: NAD(P)/FAD-dependent oxidoreductase [Candidatus Nitrohelix vancouverensis]|uniref:NAD(P)/FAD-dependent oxidoreductase n=1 Tax=Candidatus Nitrohelix vancouverensis TaxID=2705534 RepID=A0A7T0C3Y1_9BACT|nr:MAG: NAD(P)/FAD-dependent oxidoreductase [Candidatus Nitrohelix vancouverensis]
MTVKKDVVIIGGGTAGIAAALTCAEMGARVGLIEKKRLGGRLLYSDSYARQIVENILPTLESGDDHFSQLKQGCEEAFGKISKNCETNLQDLGVDIIYGEGRPAGRQVQVVGPDEKETVLEGDKIILTCGSVPHSSRHMPLDGETILSMADFWNRSHIPASIMVLGTGDLSYETARIFKALGCKVFWVLPGSRVLSHADPELCDIMERHLKQKKIKLISNKKVESFHRREGALDITLDGGLKFSAECILVSGGRKPVDMGLDAMGMRLGEHGEILTEETLETSTQGVFAAGSILGREGFHGLSEEEGRVAAENALGKVRKISRDMIPRMIHCSPELAWIGVSAQEAHHLGFRGLEGVVRTEALDAGVLNQEEGFVKLVADAESERIIGAQLACAHAGDMVDLISLVMRRGLKAQTLANLSCQRGSPAYGVRSAGRALLKAMKKRLKSP